MSAAEAFAFEGREVRTVMVDGAPWFVASDVARILGYSATAAMTRSLDDDEKGVRALHTLGGAQAMTVVSEAGLYSAIMRSTIPEARAFKRWVTHEVLPSIRKTGAYGSVLPTSFAEALELAAAEARRVEALEAQAAVDAPKIAAYERLMDADGLLSMEAVAKIGGIGRTTLYRRLREARVIEQGGSRMPYQKYLHWFDVKVTTHEARDGYEYIDHTPRVRPSALVKVLEKAGITERPQSLQQALSGLEGLS